MFEDPRIAGRWIIDLCSKKIDQRVNPGSQVPVSA
jgi:hypothetical protein